ncbi:putative leucine-rich repeat protein [Leptomonas pyrrhocoris]|uniref:Putative leucine-rich repeat protein n=1 Tax=Leptomonas pyrrhocoris TaxID=157538 RepID=A0A0N0DSE8_LEPPY|nr:putative leucine-rich repeat protein [Leptomonas pyrrhocoris]XP_015654330.1 putative leucine-rich repeat protein [Leptomonas pyrrhocoris]XP_015654331.1 putative leucine-rich repeat protein [Leptomonas pyrrhocoris]XP_015654332.1 putative leucine-rich repeat protein [Leptomonas pyrrhocoris]KPA75890.1 putative leucine-rich repeat protein [Leptomonas pyrrhocoris]KPA75891.1 putative leucine-rich repeat protein [Leptomonas pyrrhocoris]KPA75892.1 putative leucine-rich repeat protein [Leptomonas p|eukprot:XP_015654329.1 putative leucine-rich repeat protein [Leptomonas pyrrhocoris]
MLVAPCPADTLLEGADSVDLAIEQALEDGSNTFFLSHRHEGGDVPANISLLRNQLEVLHVDNNYNLAAISPRITALSRLRWLNACYGAVTSIDPTISRLSKLQRLTLNNNRLTWLPLEMWQLKELEELDLGNNKLRVLPGCLLFLPNLRVVTLENNPLLKREEVEGGAAAMFVPPQRSVDCSGCCARTRHYEVFITFHKFLGERELPFVHFACSSECASHVRTRLQRYDASHVQANSSE